MKRSVYLKGCMGFLLFLLFISVPKEAKADLIWTPNDDFFSKNYDDCEHEGREYTANCEMGYVSMYQSPGSHNKITNYVNGTVLYISFTYKDKKNTWGVFQENRDANLTGEKPITGWICMDQLVVVYDNISFTAEHKSEFKEYNGEFDDFTYDNETRIPLWTYPGSGVILYQFLIDGTPNFEYTYKDKDDRLWGFVNSGWICISDPTNENIPSIGAKSPAKLIPADPEAAADASIGDNRFVLLLLTVLVAALTIVTGILIRIFWRKGNNKK